MYFWLALPFFFQGLAITFDEFYFHHKRNLPLWERIGHPMDTASLLACALFVYFQPYSPELLKIYIGLAVISCLMVTKDEWVHAHTCVEEEHWLHSLLFILHPLVLTSWAYIWWLLAQPLTRDDFVFLKTLSLIPCLFVALFMFYQIIYWNFLCKNQLQKP